MKWKNVENNKFWWKIRSFSHEMENEHQKTVQLKWNNRKEAK